MRKKGSSYSKRQRFSGNALAGWLLLFFIILFRFGFDAFETIFMRLRMQNEFIYVDFEMKSLLNEWM